MSMELVGNHDKLLSEVLCPNVGQPEDDDYDRDESREKEQSRLMPSAALVAHFEDEVQNWTSWILELEYYVCEVPGKSATYLLFELSWDDNWGNWQWRSCAAVSEAPDQKEAIQTLLKHYARSELEFEQEGEWRNFLEKLLAENQ